MNKKNVFDTLNRFFSSWKESVRGSRGFLRAVSALLVMFVFVILAFYIVEFITFLIPLVTKFAIIIVFIGVVIFALSPFILKYLSRFNFPHRNHEKYITAQELSFSLPCNSANVRYIKLTTTQADVFVQFGDVPNILLDISVTHGQSSSLHYLFTENDDELIFKQGALPSKDGSFSYNLTITIPFGRTDMSVNARLIEGSLTTVEEGSLSELKIEAVNSAITLNDVTCQTCKLYGLNLVVTSTNFIADRLLVRSTGDSFTFEFKDDNRGAKLKTNTALSTFKINDETISKSFSHGVLELWPPKSGNDYMNLEFNTISATINFIRP